MVPVAAVGLGLGLASQGIGMLSSYVTQRRAQKALNALGKRKSLEVPQEIMKAYQDRLRRSKMYQGYSQAELGQMKSAQARQQATMFNRANMLGAPQMAIQSMAANNAALGWQNVASRNAEFNRANQAADLAAADQLAGQVGRYRYSSAENDQAYRDMIERTLGETISGERTARRNSLAEMGQLGMYAGISPEMWGINALDAFKTPPATPPATNP